MSVTGDLVDKLISTKLEDIPEEAIEIGRQVCLDGIGVMIAALREPLGLGQKAIQYTKSLGGTAESTVIGGGFKSNALNAAYSNGCLAHALDYDNTWWPLNHPTSPTLPAILALSEKYNFSGKEILRAIVLCFEVQGKMRAASLRVMPGSTFHKPGVSGTMGATTAAGVLLGLNREEFLMCYGIAGSRAGSMSANTGTMTKSSIVAMPPAWALNRPNSPRSAGPRVTIFLVRAISSIFFMVTKTVTWNCFSRILAIPIG